MDTTNTGGSMTLTEFLLARIAEDEAAAHSASGYQLNAGYSLMVSGRLMVHPARVLAECEAKRQALALLGEVNDEGVPRLTIYLRDRLPRLLAMPYAEHPNYLGEWRP